MRNIYYALNISIDACFDHTLMDPQEGVHEYFTNMMKETGHMVFGRKMYELMFPYWSDVANAQSGNKTENEFAETITAIDKTVFSTNLTNVGHNTKLLHGNLEEEILQLKQQPGKKISVGGKSLLTQLMALDLIDEFYFLIHPALAGKGPRLLEDAGLPGKVNLKLVESRVFKGGCVALHYMK